MKCPECRTAMKAGPETYKYTESGLDNVTLVGVEVRRCPQCGEVELIIPKIDELHGVLAKAFAGKPGPLTGKEIRFLRSYLGFSGTDFAAAIGASKELVSRWENDKRPMSKTHDRFLRLMIFNEKPMTYYPKDKISELASGAKKKMTVRATATDHDGWNAEST